MKGTAAIFSPVILFLFGAALGAASKLLDLHASNLGNLFSQMSVWILLGTLIAIFSQTKAKAALHVFLFCLGMLMAYYITAELAASVYGMTFLYGWAVFSACSPVFAAFTWRTQEKGIFPKIISAGILLVTLAVSIIVFDGPRVYDIVILLVLAYFLFLHKVRR